MKRMLFFIACTIFSPLINAQEVDIVSSFNIDELPGKLQSINEAFTVKRTVPVDYLKRSTENQNLKRVIVFDPIFGGGRDIMPTLRKDKLVLFVWEPNALPSDLYESYSRVYTWDDSLVDNVKFFRFNYPYLMPYRNGKLSFEGKQLCTMVVGNWTPQRLNVVKFFDDSHPSDLECYGRFPIGLQHASMYKGAIPGQHSGDEKISTLQKYRFCVCFENTVGTTGYISEKIFSCFAAGSVPIYWGPDNIERYIPSSCFIDYRNFTTNEELYQYISTMPEKEYQEYIERIKKFLQSDQAQVFSSHYFEHLIFEAINQ